jgi:hypothetical protein
MVFSEAEERDEVNVPVPCVLRSDGRVAPPLTGTAGALEGRSDIRTQHACLVDMSG